MGGKVRIEQQDFRVGCLQHAAILLFATDLYAAAEGERRLYFSFEPSTRAEIVSKYTYGQKGHEWEAFFSGVAANLN